MENRQETCCPICGSRSVELFRGGTDRALSAVAVGSSRTDTTVGRILRCRECGFGFSAARPQDSELADLYYDLDTEVYESEAQGRLWTAKRHLKIVQRHVRHGRLLDVGCASGMFISAAADAGWEVVGVEPSKTLYSRSRALLADRGEVIHATLQQANLGGHSFDAITLWDVLEHVTDPVTFMSQCRLLLKPGGYLFVNVPDLDSLQARLFGNRWPLYLQEHLNYFNRSSLDRCGELAHLTRVRWGRRPVSFSTGYVFYRLAQHRVPGATFGYQLSTRHRFGNSVVTLPLGELYGVWRYATSNPFHPL